MVERNPGSGQPFFCRRDAAGGDDQKERSLLLGDARVRFAGRYENVPLGLRHEIGEGRALRVDAPIDTKPTGENIGLFASRMSVMFRPGSLLHPDEERQTAIRMGVEKG